LSTRALLRGRYGHLHPRHVDDLRRSHDLIFVVFTELRNRQA
jgi:hypothetical protein